MKARSLVALGLVAVLGGGVSAMADMTNGGFEGGLAGWDTVGTVSATTFEMSRDFLPPVAPDWTPTEGSLFASLWSTDSMGSDSSEMSQEFAANAMDVLTFDYFFDFGDFAPMYDVAEATLSWAGSEGPMTLFAYNTPGHELADNANVGWLTYSAVLPTTGLYTLTFRLTDGVGAFESILGVDRVSVGVGSGAVPAPGAALLAVIGLGLVRGFRRRLGMN